MKRLILTASLALLTIVTPATAQQAGDNVNVLPVVVPTDLNHDGVPDDPDWYLKGDGYLQRQLEPTIAVSTRNPDHILAFFNDYRAVDISDDVGLGEGDIAALALKASRLYLAMVPWLDLPEIDLPAVKASPTAASEAWVGMSRSYDGGLTWSGGFLPGGLFDKSAASQASPVHGLEAATDPVAVAGPCGKFYVVFVAFTRGGQSKLAVARYEDLNNDPGGDTIVYKGTTVIETGNNATYGHFLDKPHINIDVFRSGDSKKKPKPPSGGDTDQCSDRVYVSYSTFTGKPKPGKFQSKVNFAVSEDGGLTYSKQKINKNFGQNQGTVIAVDPREGTPDGGGGGSVYVFWRHFNKPDDIIMTKSTNFGGSWSSPKKIIGNVPMATFDQPTISTEAAIGAGFVDGDDRPEVAFRSNAFPTAAVTVDNDTGDDTVFVAWQERIGTDGYPLEGGSPRIVLMRSEDGGDSWTDVEGNPDVRKAVDYLDSRGGEPAGFGLLPQIRLSGPQVMPTLSFAGGRLMLLYSESRGWIEDYGEPSERLETSPDVSMGTGFISGYTRVMDTRASLLDPGSGELQGSFQVSRYLLNAGSDLSEETLTDVAPINPPCSPDYDGLGLGVLNPCVRQVNRVNAPHSAAGTSPFIGDYLGLHPFVQFVTDMDGNWRWAIEPGDLPTRGFHAVWADNRHVLPPQNPNPGGPWIEWAEYPDYDAPGSGSASCANPGSRNTDVLTSRVNADLVLNAPTTFKEIGPGGATFPFTVNNKTEKTRTYQLTVAPAGITSFLPQADEDSVTVEIFPFSSTAQVVYVTANTSDPITVTVDEFGTCDSGGCQSGSITFNAHQSMASNQVVTTEYFDPTIEPDAFVINYTPESAFVINPGEENAFVINPGAENAFVINQGEENAFVINAFVINAFVINAFVINSGTEDKAGGDPEYYDVHDVIDTTWTVRPGASTDASSFLPLLNIDNPERFLDNYVFQLIVHKGSLYGALDGCTPTNVNQTQVLSTFAQGPNDLNDDKSNAFVINPSPQNAFVINRGGGGSNFPRNAFVINSTFAVAPSDEPAGTKSGTSNDGTLKAPRAPDEVFVTLRAYQIKPTQDMIDEGDDFYNPYSENPYADDDPRNATWKKGDKASFAAASHNCDTSDIAAACVEFNAPDLIPYFGGHDPDNPESSMETPSDWTAPVREVGTTFDFPVWSLKNFGTTDGNAENDVLRHSFYLCPDGWVEIQPDYLPLDLSQCIAFDDADAVFTDGDSLSPGGMQTFDALAELALTVPEAEPGDYDVVAYVDDQYQVSEFREVNNFIHVPIIIVGELTANGSFETPELTRSWDIYPDGTEGLGWNVQWSATNADAGCSETQPTVANLEFQRAGAVGGVGPFLGTQYVELDTDWNGPTGGGLGCDEPANVRISSQFTSIAGRKYVVTYAWRPRTVTDAMKVFFGDPGSASEIAQREAQGSGDWKLELSIETATSATAEIAFEEVGPANSLGMFLDAVSVVGPYPADYEFPTD